MSIFDIAYLMMMDFINNHLGNFIFIIICFSVMGFSFFNKR